MILYDLSKSIDVGNMEIPCPKGLAYLPFQKAGIMYAATLDSNVLFADEPGLGKTIQSIGVMNYKHQKSALVLCPASLCENWKREIEKWHVLKPSVKIYNPKTWGEEIPDIAIMSYSYVSQKRNIIKLLSVFKKYDVLVLDECQNLKNYKAKRTKHVLAKRGLKALAKQVHAISGTPIVNRPIELYPILNSLCPVAIDNMSYIKYGFTYCNGFNGPWGLDFSGASNLRMLGQKLRSRFMVRRLKKNVLDSLPEKQINIKYLSPTSEINRLVSKTVDFDIDKILNNKISLPDFTELSKHRHDVGVASAPLVAGYIKTQLEAGHKKVCIFAHHKEVIRILKKELKDYFGVMLTGDTPTNERQNLVDIFQKDENCRFFIGSITAAGVGLTLTKSSYVIFAEPSWVPGENFQAIDRVHRIGQEGSVVVDFLVFEKSLHERILKVVLEKNENIKGAMHD